MKASARRYVKRNEKRENLRRRKETKRRKEREQTHGSFGEKDVEQYSPVGNILLSCGQTLFGVRRNGLLVKASRSISLAKTTREVYPTRTRGGRSALDSLRNPEDSSSTSNATREGLLLLHATRRIKLLTVSAA